MRLAARQARILVSELPVKATKASVFFSPSSTSKSHIPPVAIDNHGAVVKQLGQAVAAVQVVVHDFHLHVVRDVLGGAYGNPASTHNHHVAHIGIIFFAGYLADVGDVFSCGGEVYDVM